MVRSIFERGTEQTAKAGDKVTTRIAAAHAVAHRVLSLSGQPGNEKAIRQNAAELVALLRAAHEQADFAETQISESLATECLDHLSYYTGEISEEEYNALQEVALKGKR